CSRRWRAFAFSRMSLPEPVTRTRFLVPEWVLFFGIGLFLLVTFSGLGAGLGLGRGLVVLAAGRCLLGVGLALAGLGHGLGLLLVRPEDHHHVAAVLPRVGLDEAVLRDVLRHALQELDAPLGTGLLTTAEADDDLHLVAAVEELLDVATL